MKLIDIYNIANFFTYPALTSIQQEMSIRPFGLSLKRILEEVCIPAKNAHRNPGLREALIDSLEIQNSSFGLH